jgi:hypothetical protein
MVKFFDGGAMLKTLLNAQSEQGEVIFHRISGIKLA